MAADGGESVAESDLALSVPFRGSDDDCLGSVHGIGPQRNEREEPEQDRGGARNSLIRPLALRFDAKVTAHFGEGDLERPAPDEPRQDVCRVGMAIGAASAEESI